MKVAENGPVGGWRVVECWVWPLPLSRCAAPPGQGGGEKGALGRVLSSSCPGFSSFTALCTVFAKQPAVVHVCGCR